MWTLRLDHNLSNGRHAELLDVQLPRLLWIEQHLLDDPRTIILSVQSLPLPVISADVQFLSPETVERREFDILDPSELHPGVDFEDGPHRLSLVGRMAIDGYPHQQIVGPDPVRRLETRLSALAAPTSRTLTSSIDHLDVDRFGRIGLAVHRSRRPRNGCITHGIGL